MRKSALEKMREAQTKKRGVTVEIRPTHLVEDLAKMMLGGPPRPTQLAVLQDPHPAIAYMGHAGAAKTATGVCKILMRAILEPGSIFLIARKDGNDLKNTTMREAERQLANLPAGTRIHRVKDEPETWTLQPAAWLGMEGASEEPSQIIFAGLETLDTGSLNINGFMLDEADEIMDEEKVLTLMGRARNKQGSPEMAILCFNGPSEEHWLYAACTGKDAKGNKVSGKPYLKLYSPKARENEPNVATGYYDKLEKLYASNPALLARLVKGDWVGTFKGIAVYPMFKEHIHTTVGLEWNPNSPIVVGLDFGFNQPRAIYGQVDAEGRLAVLGELVKTQLEIRPFISLVKVDINQRFPNNIGVLWYGDAAARQKKDTGSTLAVLSQEDVHLQYRQMEIDPSIRTVREALDQMIRGVPSILVDRKEAPVLTNALKGGYRMADNGLKPFKDGYYDNSADAFRYLYVNLFGITNFRPNHPDRNLGPVNGYGLPDSAAYDPNLDPMFQGN